MSSSALKINAVDSSETSVNITGVHGFTLGKIIASGAAIPLQMHISNSCIQFCQPWRLLPCTRWKYWRFPHRLIHWRLIDLREGCGVYCLTPVASVVWCHVSIAALIGLRWNGLFCTVLTSACTSRRYKSRRMLVQILRSVSARFCSIKWARVAKCLRIFNRQDECLASINVRFSTFHTSVRDTYVSRPRKVAFTAFKYNT